MKNIVYALSLFIMLTLALPAMGAEYQVKKTVNGLEVEATIDKNPPAMGENSLTVVIRDQSGAAITDAKVRVEYGMPAMPGMPAMNYKSDATVNGQAYVTPINFSMSGAWNMTVKVKYNDKISSVKFNVDVR